jgi:hypothetical protein
MARTMNSDAQFHVIETARAARAAHARMMADQSGAALFVYFRTRRIEAFPDGEVPTGEGWTLAWPERVPGSLTADQLVGYFAARTGRLPYLGED